VKAKASANGKTGAIGGAKGGAKVMQTDSKGGKFYVTASGNKVYEGK
jgi:hypothetical protein